MEFHDIGKHLLRTEWGEGWVEFEIDPKHCPIKNRVAHPLAGYTEFRMIWEPSREFIEQTNVWRFMQRLGFNDREAFLQFSRDEPERFWDETMRDMGVEWFQPYGQVMDDSRGPEWTQWFVGGKLNIAHNCLDRWADSGRLACVWEGENGATRALTFADVQADANRVANGLLRSAWKPAIAWLWRCPWFPRFSPSFTAVSRRASRLCPSSRALARARSPPVWRIPARAYYSRPRIWSGAARRCRS